MKSRPNKRKNKSSDSEKTVSKATLKLRLLKRLKCTLKYEKLAWGTGATLVAGVDEVGRGSLFGPVVAAAVILDPAYRIRGLRDSKLLDRETREKLAPRIREHASGLGRGRCRRCDDRPDQYLLGFEARDGRGGRDVEFAA